MSGGLGGGCGAGGCGGCGGGGGEGGDGLSGGEGGGGEDGGGGGREGRMGGGGEGGAVGGLGGINGGGRSRRLGSRAPSHMATPMGTARMMIHGRQHHSEKHGHSRRSGGTTRLCTTSVFSYTKTLRVGLVALSLVAPVLVSEWNVSCCMPPTTTWRVRV